MAWLRYHPAVYALFSACAADAFWLRCELRAWLRVAARRWSIRPTSGTWTFLAAGMLTSGFRLALMGTLTGTLAIELVYPSLSRSIWLGDSRPPCTAWMRRVSSSVASVGGPM